MEDRLFNNTDFYPTPISVIDLMMSGEIIKDKIFLEPECGKCDIVDYLYLEGAKEVLGCEIHEDLRRIAKEKVKLIGKDFLDLKSHEISHIDHIVMNPPFSNGDEHILHAYNIAPAGCKITALCNMKTITNPYSKTRKELLNVIDSFGYFENIGDCYSNAERTTNVEIALIRIQKAGSSANDEFEGFFLEEEPEEQGENGIMRFDAVRDIVQRYVNAVKCFDEHRLISDKMNNLTAPFKVGSLGFTVSGRDKIIFTKEDFCKELQKKAWDSIFNKMNMDKYATKSVKDDINKFVEKQHKIPFTMKNVYHMIYIIVGTQSSRMEKSILEVFEKITRHYDENRYNVEGWKTNSHYLLNKRFIAPNCVEVGCSGQVARCNWGSSNFEMIEDLVKALCYITGDNYDNFISLDNFIQYRYKLVDSKGNFINNKRYDFICKIYSYDLKEVEREKSNYYDSSVLDTKVEWGQWFEWAYFRVRAYKKGTLHIEFKDNDLVGRFNQIVAKLKGYPLYEYKEETSKRKSKKSN